MHIPARFHMGAILLSRPAISKLVGGTEITYSAYYFTLDDSLTMYTLTNLTFDPKRSLRQEILAWHLRRRQKSENRTILTILTPFADMPLLAHDGIDIDTCTMRKDGRRSENF